MPVAPPGARPADTTPDVRRVTIPARPAAALRGGSGDGGSANDGGGSGRPRQGLPLWLAVTAIVVIGSLLTTLGMFSQILANLAGSQLPGA